MSHSSFAPPTPPSPARRGQAPTLAALVAVTLLGCSSGGGSGPASARAPAAPAATAATAAAVDPAARAEGFPFRVEVVGAGRPMILIPGLMSSGEVWKGAVEHYRDRYECHVLTLAGFAGVPPRPGPFLETMRRGVLDYVAARGLDRPVVVGHSLGGVLALDLAAEAPDRIGPVVIVDALPFLGGVMAQAETSAEVEPLAARIRAKIASAAPGERAASQRQVLAGMITDPAQQEIAFGWSMASDPTTAAQAMYEVMVADLRPKLGRVRSPALVLGSWAMTRGAVPLEQYRATLREMYRPLPGATTAVSERAKHFIMLDEPTWFTKQVDDFLTARAPATPAAPHAAR